MDVTEDEKEFTITADLPDVKKDDVKITLHEGLLTIHGERKHETEEKNKKYHRVERSFGSYTRSFQLPKDVDPDKIQAQFEEGVLHVHLPKAPESKPKQQEIKVS
jgi:HSP20 family protein